MKHLWWLFKNRKHLVVAKESTLYRRHNRWLYVPGVKEVARFINR